MQPTRLTSLFFLLLTGVFSSAARASPIFTPLFAGNPSFGANSKDNVFQTACDQPYAGANQGTNCESFGFEVSFNANQEARFNAITGAKPFANPPYGSGNPNPFAFSVASTNINGGGVWVSGRTYRFSYSYGGDSTPQTGPPAYVNTGGSLSVTVTDPGADGLFNGVSDTVYTINYQPRYGEVQALAIRMVAGDPDVPNRPTSQQIAFTNWTLGGSSIAGMPATQQLTTTDTPGVDDIRLIDYFALTGIDFRQAWNLTGDFTLTWSGGTLQPENNGLAFQVKALTADPGGQVPEPATAGLIGSGLLLAGLVARRRPVKIQSLP